MALALLGVNLVFSFCVCVALAFFCSYLASGMDKAGLIHFLFSNGEYLALSYGDLRKYLKDHPQTVRYWIHENSYNLKQRNETDFRASVACRILPVKDSPDVFLRGEDESLYLAKNLEDALRIMQRPRLIFETSLFPSGFAVVSIKESELFSSDD